MTPWRLIGVAYPGLRRTSLPWAILALALQAAGVEVFRRSFLRHAAGAQALDEDNGADVGATGVEHGHEDGHFPAAHLVASGNDRGKALQGHGKGDSQISGFRRPEGGK